MNLNKIKHFLIFLVTLTIASCAMEPQPAFATTGNWYSEPGYKFVPYCNVRLGDNDPINTDQIVGISIVKTTVTVTLKDRAHTIIFKNQQKAFEWVQELLDGKKCT